MTRNYIAGCKRTGSAQTVQALRILTFLPGEPVDSIRECNWSGMHGVLSNGLYCYKII